jgi:hypothetical protein
VRAVEHLLVAGDERANPVIVFGEIDGKVCGNGHIAFVPVSVAYL